MIERLRKALAVAFVGAAVAILPCTGHSTTHDAWPERPITMIVPFPPAGPTDMVARLLAMRLTKQLGQPVVVQNMPGASATIGMKYAANARPDGYTVLYNTSSIVLSPIVYAGSGLDPRKDFIAVSSTAVAPLVLLAHPAVHANDFKSFVSFVRESDGQVAYASAGAGNVTHLTALLLLQSLDVRAVHVPYRGSAPALADLIRGETQFMLNPVNDALPHVREGKLRALAVTSKKRVDALPDVPTIAELGIAEFESGAWQGVVVPAGTPSVIVERLSTEIRKALESESMQAQLTGWGTRPLGSSPQDYAQYIGEEYERWGAVIEAAQIQQY